LDPVGPTSAHDDGGAMVGSEGPRDPGGPAPYEAAFPKKSIAGELRAWLRDYFVGEEPTFGIALVPMCFLSMLLFTRHPLKTNFIFDEQEALLANPYVRSVADPASKLHWMDAFYRDFWGLAADRSIGSYRPVPDLVWRALWAIGARESPFLHHWVNVLLHGVNGALIVVLVVKLTQNRRASWLCGVLFVASAIVTEAVSGVVGIADVLGGLGALLALHALRLPMWGMPFAVFAATLFGLYSKESALCCVPLVPLAALFAAPSLHPERPLRWARATLAFVATAVAFVFYVEARRRCFPAPIAAELSIEANANKPLVARTFATMLRWYAQPSLPKDPLNNPLIDATPQLRVAGGLRVYARGLFQVIFPWTLSGDYSSPQEPIPARAWFPESILGALGMVGPPIAAGVLGVRAWLRAYKFPYPRVDASLLVAIGLAWVVISYFPVSNIPVVLPTVRAERFWYFPVIGTCIFLGLAFDKLIGRWRGIGIAAFLVYLGIQGVSARRHANDYTDDLVFWDATRKAVPRSAKAHLNYSVMQGARGRLDIRLESNKTALALAPEWPMASVYLGDTLCRLGKPVDAWPYYEKGFGLAPNDINLIALGVQCLWDQQGLAEGSPIRDQLKTVGEAHAGSWLEYIAHDTLDNGEEHKGVDPKYRPRGYNEGPKQE
jgi:hypothetical protein